MLFIASKLFWGLIAPGNFLLLLLASGAARLARSRGRRGRGAVTATVVALLAIAILPVGHWLVRPLEARFPVPAPPARVDGIILLGGAVEPFASPAPGQVVLNASAERLLETLALARRYPEAKLLISGGNGKLVPGGGNEAMQTRSIFLAQGIDADRMLLEDRSRDTAENAAFSLARAQPRPGEVWLLVTSANHMPRADGCFRHLGWNVVPYPVDFHPIPSPPLGFALAEHLRLVDLATREWIGLVAYRLMGRIDSVFPGP